MNKEVVDGELGDEGLAQVAGGGGRASGSSSGARQPLSLPPDEDEDEDKEGKESPVVRRERVGPSWDRWVPDNTGQAGALLSKSEVLEREAAMHVQLGRPTRRKPRMAFVPGNPVPVTIRGKEVYLDKVSPPPVVVGLVGLDADWPLSLGLAQAYRSWLHPLHKVANNASLLHWAAKSTVERTLAKKVSCLVPPLAWADC